MSHHYRDHLQDHQDNEPDYPNIDGPLWKCTGCKVRGIWRHWESEERPGKHQCDWCYLNGTKGAKLVRVRMEAK